jgi:hypothetical protein
VKGELMMMEKHGYLVEIEPRSVKENVEESV